jgi:mannose/cellobiose epimerase-like protein (N-acyl-D-glucosamine 2-epimerase family)
MRLGVESLIGGAAMAASMNFETGLKWLAGHAAEDVLPHWLRRSVRPEGPFLPRLDERWRPDTEQMATIVSQGRLVYNFATGYRMTGDDAYMTACRKGADFLSAALRDPLHGGWHFACDAEGRILDNKKDSYGHAFVVFGLSHAHHVTGDPRYAAAAEEAWSMTSRRLGDGAGAVVLSARREFTGAASGRSQNPVMHLFEALLALATVGGRPQVRGDASDLASFVLERLIGRPGQPLPEVYNDDWRPLEEADGGRIDIGHQLEWAFLLSRAVELGFPAEWLGWAEGLLDYAVAHGLDESGGVLSPAAPHGALPSHARKGWWEQCEALRAFGHWALVRGRDDLREPFERTLAWAREALVDAELGGWKSSPDDPTKGSEWKVDYHVVALCDEAARLLGDRD